MRHCKGFTSTLVVTLALSGMAQPARATSNSWFNDEESLNYSRPDWMGELPDSLLISQLAIPGTHDAMALGDWDQPAAVQCQSLSLASQLQAGIRAVDIRCRHIDDGFAIHHGPFYQHANFTDVLEASAHFLSNHPTEVVFMKVADEYEPSGNTRTFMETLKAYLSLYPDLFWTTDDYTVMPPLGEVRGKIILMDAWKRETWETDSLGIPWGWTGGRDDYSVRHSRAAFDQKWEYIQMSLCDAKDAPPDTMYASGLNGNIPDDWDVDDLLITPAKVANGMYIVEWPPWESGWEDGMNERTYRYLKGALKRGELWRTGLIMMDFPGRGLIDVVIAHNGLGMVLEDDPPVADAGGPYSADEGFLVVFDGSGSSDADGDTLLFRWDFDSDGTWEADWSLNPTVEHSWPDEIETSVTLEVMDSRGANSDLDVAAVIIANVAPLVSIDSVHSPIPGCVLPQHTVRFFGSFKDPGYLDTHTALWRVGTDTPVVSTLVEENEPPDATGQSQYEYLFPCAGTFAVSWTVTDDDEGEGSDSLHLLVRTPCEVLDYIDSVVQALPRYAFKKPADERKNAITNKLHATRSMLRLGDNKGATSKLAHDLRAKWDGWVDGHAANDWIIDPDAQALLCLTVDELISYIESDPCTKGGEEPPDDDPVRQVLLPTKYGLAQNYPNPFNPDTRILFNLEAACHVRLDIYNVMGRRVLTLADGYFQEGPHVLVWDGTGDSGRILPGGVYLYRLTAGSSTETRKMLMLK